MGLGFMANKNTKLQKSPLNRSMRQVM